MEILLLVLAHFVFAVMVGAVAKSRGRDAFWWWLLAMLLSPLIAFLFLVAIPSHAEKRQREAAQREVERGTMKLCRECLESIPREARRCRACGAEQPEYGAPAESTP